MWMQRALCKCAGVAGLCAFYDKYARPDHRYIGEMASHPIGSSSETDYELTQASHTGGGKTRAPPPSEIHAIYEASDGPATRTLFSFLKRHGINGQLAIALFRACKSSERAKVYRGGVRGRGSFREMAYDRKQQAMDNLCEVLSTSMCSWGWGIDNEQPVHKDVLYVELPTGQVSFHSGRRGTGPDYSKPWDGMPGQSAGRIYNWIHALLPDGVFTANLK
jgi:hypothetical protein